MGVLRNCNWEQEEDQRFDMNDDVRRGAPGHFVHLTHGDVHFELVGNKNDPLIVCIPGWSTASYVWEPLKPHLIAKGYCVLTFDIYGRGYSARPDVEQSADLFSQQLSELLETLDLGESRLNIIGYSMGGAIAAKFASHRIDQIDRLFFIAPAGMAVRSPIPRFLGRLLPKLAFPLFMCLGPDRLRRNFEAEAKDFSGSEDVQGVLKNQLRELSYKGYLKSLFFSLNGILANKMKKEHRAIATSNIVVKAIFAEGDETIPLGPSKRRFDRWNRDGVSVIISDAGHAVTYTHPHQVMCIFDDLT